MPNKIRLTSRAEEDATKAALYLEKQRPQLGMDFLAAVDSARLAIQSNPLLCPRVSARLRRYVMARFPYNLYFLTERDEIVVVAVTHAKRHPRTWQSRE
jgi:plasmid stabilization system protein ParE